MSNPQLNWQWKEGEVDERREHIELRYGDAGETPYENWTTIARIAKPKRHVFKVEWLVKEDSSEIQAMLADARKDLSYFLVELNEPNPWAYAVYHCNTSSNMYSSVHWSYFPTGNQGKRHASKVIKLSAEESAQLFGDSKKPGKYINKE